MFGHVRSPVSRGIRLMRLDIGPLPACEVLEPSTCDVERVVDRHNNIFVAQLHGCSSLNALCQ